MQRSRRGSGAGHGFGVLMVVFMLLAACGSPSAVSSRQRAAAANGVIVVLISGMPTEPAPRLSPRASALARQVAESNVAQDGPQGVTGLAVVATSDASAPVVTELTPRRANGEIEHGLQRDPLIAARLGVLDASVRAARSDIPTLDLLDAIDRAIAGYGPGTLVVVSNGLSTTGGLDLRKVGWNADPVAVARQLDDRHLLPHLEGWDVLWTGLNETRAPQPALPLPVRETNRAYWAAICERSGARSCAFDDTTTGAAAPLSAVPPIVVPVPAVDSVVGPDGRVRATLPDALLGFGPDSAVISRSAATTITELAAQIVGRPQGGPDVIVTGYCADPPGSTPAALLALSQQRAAAVAAALHGAGVTNPIRVVAGGVPHGDTAVRDGHFIESLADPMRRVEVSY